MITLSVPQMDQELRPRITVFGVGGAGGNAVNNMIRANLEGVEFVVANTDAQAIKGSLAERRIQLGTSITRGLGAGSRPDVGRAAAEEQLEEIMGCLDGANMVFITAGMGGGTGTGAAPVIARTAREQGILTVGVVTKPFHFEGAHRMRLAEAGIQELQQFVDTLIIIPNQNLFRIANERTTFADAFKMADDVLHSGVRGVTDLMIMPGLINLDFADIRAVMSEMGKAMMGTGEGEGENRALQAAEQAIANPLLDGVSMAGAKGVIISIIGGEDMRLLEVDEAANHIRELVDEDANIIWGSAFNPDLKGKIRVSVVATGIEQSAIGHIERPQPVSLGLSRAPKRPVLELSEDEGLVELPAEEPPAPAPAPAAFAADSYEAAEEEIAEEAGYIAPAYDAVEEAEEEDEGEGDFNIAAPFDLTGMQAGDDMGEEYEDDVDEIVDPLAGLRNVGQDEYGADEEDGETLDLTGGYAPYDEVEQAPAPAPYPAQDDLLASADRLAADDQPVTARLGGARRRPLLGGDGGGAAGGSTLFERMANLSRSTGRADDEDEDEDEGDGSSGGFSIPRFIDRNRNQ